MGKAQVGVDLLDGLLQLGQVLLHGFAVMTGEHPVGLAVEDDRGYPEFLQQKRRCVHGCAVGAVQNNFEICFSDCLGIHFGDYGIDILLAGILHAGHVPDLIPINCLQVHFISILYG